MKLNFAILEVLRRYTDSEHTLNQKDIVELLERDFAMKADRKSIKRNITGLLEMGYPIEFTETLRRYPNKDGQMEDSYILSDFYLEREFTDAELRLLIDGLLFSKHIAYSQCKELVEKLKAVNIHAEADCRSEKLGYKIREAQLQKIPYMLVIGDRDMEAGTVSVRTRKGDDLGAMTPEAFISKCLMEIATKSKDI